jgi:hypothetical protein
MVLSGAQRPGPEAQCDDEGTEGGYRWLLPIIGASPLVTLHVRPPLISGLWGEWEVQRSVSEAWVKGVMQGVEVVEVSIRYEHRGEIRRGHLPFGQCNDQCPSDRPRSIAPGSREHTDRGALNRPGFAGGCFV